MGQRLVFRCVKNGKRFASIYYHWSGYTYSIYQEAAELFDWLGDNGYTGGESMEELQKMLLTYLESRGGGASGYSVEYDEWKKRGIVAKTDGVSRNNGLIDITDKGMRNAESWGEAIETIDFDDETFTNNEFFHESAGEFDWIEHPKTIPAWNPDPRYVGTIKWTDARDGMCWFDSLPRYEGILGIDADGFYVCATE